MIRIKNTKLTRIISIATVLVALASIAGAALWTTGDTLPVQAQDLPDGFEYGRRTTFPSVTLIEGNITQTASKRIPLNAILQLRVNGQTTAGNASVTHATISAVLSNDNLTLRPGIDPLQPANRNLTGTTDGVDHVLFLGAKLGTTTVTLTPVSGSPDNWNDTSLALTVEVYEPTVKTEDLNMPAAVTLNEGDTRNIPIDWTREAAGLLERDDVTINAAIAETGSASNSSISVRLVGTRGNGSVRVTANADADSDDETATYQLYFASNRARLNGKYEQTLTISVTDTTAPPTVIEGTATPTPEPKATDATLSAMTVTGATIAPTFAAGTTSYTAQVENSVSSVTVTATANDSSASVVVTHNGASVSGNTVSLIVGINSINVEVTAEDEVTTEDYSIVIVREAAVDSGDASTVCLQGDADVRQTCLLREILNELKKANAPPPEQN